MTRIFTTIHINQPVKRVFEFMTTPDNWPKWHPRVIRVTGATDHSLLVSERVTEEFIDAGKHICSVWTVIERAESRRWVVIGNDLEGSRVAFTFNRISTDQILNGTRLEREKTYTISNLFCAVYDWLIVQPRKKMEAAEALKWLKEYLEKT